MVSGDTGDHVAIDTCRAHLGMVERMNAMQNVQRQMGLDYTARFDRLETKVDKMVWRLALVVGAISIIPTTIALVAMLSG
jgi:hypothetical protein